MNSSLEASGIRLEKSHFGWFGLIFVLAGLGILILGVNETKKVKALTDNSVTVTGTVVDYAKAHYSRARDRTMRKDYYAPVIEFVSENGQTHRFYDGTYTEKNDFKKGHQFQVVYERNNPQNARLKSFEKIWGGPILIFAFGLIFVALGSRVLMTAIEINRTNKFLKVHGQVINARIIEMDVFYRKNEVSQWIIRASWVSPAGKTHEFRSKAFSFDPAKYLGETIRVVIAPNNPDRYSMDISQIPGAK